MLVSEILRIKGNTLFTTPPERSLLQAVEVMAEHDIGSLVVILCMVIMYLCPGLTLWLPNYLYGGG